MSVARTIFGLTLTGFLMVTPIAIGQDASADQVRADEALQRLQDKENAENSTDVLKAKIHELESQSKALKDQLAMLQAQNYQLSDTVAVLKSEIAGLRKLGKHDSGSDEISESIPPDVLARGESERERRIADADQEVKNDLESYRKIMHDDTLAAPDRRDQAAVAWNAVQLAKNRITLLESLKGRFLPPIEPLEVGSVGMLSEDLKVFQVIDKNNVIVQHGDAQMIWVAGVDTTRLTDGSPLEISQPVKVIGTKQYSTALGSTNTVFLAKLIDFPEPASDGAIDVPTQQ
jgi:hypothetical protein